MNYQKTLLHMAHTHIRVYRYTSIVRASGLRFDNESLVSSDACLSVSVQGPQFSSIRGILLDKTQISSRAFLGVKGEVIAVCSYTELIFNLLNTIIAKKGVFPYNYRTLSVRHLLPSRLMF